MRTDKTSDTMKVLVACEFSGVVRRAFASKGHEAWSCDLLPSDDESFRHIQGDVLNVINQQWDLIIAHPPCTFLCNSGVRWLYEDDSRWDKMRKAAKFFKVFLEHGDCPVAIENPIMHKHAIEIIGRRQDQVIQPWQFGHGETKATCLWLNGLSKLTPTDVVDERQARVHKEPPGKGRWKKRSVTYKGIADAMAEQWGITITKKPRHKAGASLEAGKTLSNF